MCGIAGVRLTRGGSIDQTRLRAAADALAHRGPDDSQVWLDGPVGFGHTRLAVIDLAGSRQPIHAFDGSWSLVFNGEIFNYRQLRRDLDYPFSMAGDTEVLLAGLVRHGIGFVDRLRGQFAFAAFDHATGTLHLVRDRLGILPLYYRHDEDGLMFASEVKAINRLVTRPPEVDSDSLDAYLTGRSVAAPFTLFKGVSKLPPGHRAELAAGGRLTLRRYWELPQVQRPPAEMEPDVVVDDTERYIRDAVSAALVADVPVGSLLSGGVDSSLIVAVMKELRGSAPVDTFSAGFGDRRFDELDWARKVSEYVGTRHHEVVVSPDDFLALWPTLTWHRDAPMSEPADMAVFRLAELARQHVTVVLSGEGGDELFGGYPKYRYAARVALLSRVPAVLRSGPGGFVERRLPARFARVRTALRAASAATELEQLATWFAPFTEVERRRLLGGSPPAARRRTVPAGVDSVDRMLRYDIESWLPDNLLERGDRMCMATSLELRPPLLDHVLVEHAFSLPSGLKVRGGVPKWLLKEVARRYLPAEIVDRRKVGFRVPLDSWFRGDLRDAVWDRLTGGGSFVATVFDADFVRRLLERHGSGRYNEESRIWTLVSLEVWHEVCIRAEAGGSR